MTAIPDFNLDLVLCRLGTFKKFTLCNFLLLMIPIIFAGMFSSEYIFEMSDSDYRCLIEECEHMTNDTSWIEYAIPKENNGYRSKCERYEIKSYIPPAERCKNASDFDTDVKILCKSYVYADDESVVKDFNLGCNDYQRAYIGVFHNLGQLISIPLSGVISDKFGRKVALSLSLFISGCFVFARSFSISYTMLLTFEFLETGLGYGTYATSFVMATELVEAKYRAHSGTFVCMFIVVGKVITAVIFWKVHGWRTPLRIISVPATFGIAFYFILNESLRWLITKGRISEAVEILQKAARMNKVTLPKKALLPLLEYEWQRDSAGTEQRSGICRVLKSRIVRNRVITCSMMWIACAFIFHGLGIQSITIPGNKYTNFIMVMAIEIPANFTVMAVVNRLGRKWTIFISSGFSAIFCIIAAFPSKSHQVLALVIMTICKFMISVAFCVLYIYVSEVFPTHARQTLLSICSSLGRIGSVAAPFVTILAMYYENLPTIFFGAVAVTTSFLIFNLPETNKHQLPDTIEDAESLADNHKTCLDYMNVIWNLCRGKKAPEWIRTESNSGKQWDYLKHGMPQEWDEEVVDKPNTEKKSRKDVVKKTKKPEESEINKNASDKALQKGSVANAATDQEPETAAQTSGTNINIKGQDKQI